MEKNTFYNELELPKNCTSDEIKQKYRILAQLHHPDKGGDVEKFKKIKLAYEVLSDPIKREHYDSTGDHYDDTNLDTEVLARLSVMVSQYSQQINPEFDDLILKMKFDLHYAQEQTNIAITNTTTAAVTATVALATIALVSGISVAANSTQFIDLEQIVYNTETITGTASTTAVNFHIAGYEVY